MFKIGVLASGKGTNLKAIIDYIKGEKASFEIGIVLSDNLDANALTIAKNEGIKAEYISPGRYKTFLEPEIEKKYVNILKENKVELVCLAGFMRVIKKHF